MATSGEYDLILNLGEILYEAYDRLQIAADGETLGGSMLARGTRSLNLMLKHWENQGLHLWTYQEGTLFPQKGQASYDLNTANVANTWFETQATADILLGATTIPVASTSEMQVGDNVGIILQDNSIQWTTILTIPNSTEFTIAVPLTQAANLGTFVRNYRDAFIPVRRITEESVRRREGNDYEIPIIFESRKDYFDLPNKEQLGTPIQVYYQRTIKNGTMYLWNTPFSALPVINFSYERPIQIMVNLSDTLDVPQEWQEAVIANLAVKLIPKFGASPKLSQELNLAARESLSEAIAFNQAVYPVTMELEQYG